MASRKPDIDWEIQTYKSLRKAYPDEFSNAELRKLAGELVALARKLGDKMKAERLERENRS